MSGEGVPEIRGLRTRIVVWLLHRAFMMTRGMTLGVRAACFDEQGRIFLVRHTYVPGWYMPGGGVERGETALDALRKELREEGNLEIRGEIALFQAYYNRNASRRDHVLFYRVKVEQTAPRAPDREIAESGFFALDALPEDTTGATLRRLRELSGETERADYW
ncbi:NUDIX domain-containing protein [Neorhizobium galegae]|uniref:NUDIX domain-containing protein n=1 Tax=Neorhizobium galegae TaxID=399 RepID=UPI0006225CED|nr:NUDIX domain-containing protein [Neorhizobium galegae]MCQ1765775.1 NUDIX domain-containing protein [Neorhizobium galegae]MCQ1844689.1 NUDIX domain-containing protein [Neorhizobium galegae]CDZ39301.1 NUDIX hydrolase [Neorhizobium galegae bv. officinalis]